ncbi:hypothetical protein [Synechococcus sp. CBW1108]|uniref:hypothetical protein n=1 Tax=Synechococcus sp. CBW1108 TaxID=1353147 RepID=UPI0018CDA948|nr:hypothetical protein [Synechococcus sp. CBW1108]QPN70013.1 hypothetical protein H8F27_16555 [Synechococcus sp. CBW1108]
MSFELSIPLLSAIEAAREKWGFDSSAAVVDLILSEILLRGITDDKKRRLSIELSIPLLSAIEGAREEMGFDSRAAVVDYILSEILLTGMDDAPEASMPLPTDQGGGEVV